MSAPAAPPSASTPAPTPASPTQVPPGATAVAPAMPPSGPDHAAPAAAGSAEAAGAAGEGGSPRKALLGAGESSADPAWQPSLLSRISGAVLAGALFGFALNKGAVYRPDVIRDQFSFSDNTMLLMFLSATSSSILTVAALKSSPWKASVLAGGKKYLSDPTVSLFSVLLGGALIGVGMRVSGTCPGTIYSQLGSGAVKTVATFGGALVGALLHGVAREPLMPWLTWGAVKDRTADGVTGWGLWGTASLFVGGLATVLGVVSTYAWTPRAGTAAVAEWGAPYWNPILAGALIGLIQLPLATLAHKNLGASTSLSVLAAHSGGRLLPRSSSPYLAKLAGDPMKWLDVLFVAACAAGSAAAAATATPGGNFTTAADMAGVSWVEAVLGGLVLGFGARFANGCTSGHGITGAGHLSLVSFAGVAAIFAGGIATAAAYGDYGA